MQIKLYKTVYGDDFATAQPGYYSEFQGNQFMIRQVSFNASAGLPTYICRIVWVDGTQSNTFVHNINAAMAWFESQFDKCEFELEGNKR